MPSFLLYTVLYDSVTSYKIECYLMGGEEVKK